MARDPSGAVFALFRTRDTEETRAKWPHPFRASVRVTLDESLSTALTIENTGQEPFPFHDALHTYLRVGDLRKVTVEGLAGALYQDRTRKSVERRERRTPIRIQGEVDRIYVARPDRLIIRDASRDRAILVDRAGFNDVVLWNPGEEKARTKSGLAEAEYLTMLAVVVGADQFPRRLAAEVYGAACSAFASPERRLSSRASVASRGICTSTCSDRSADPSLRSG